jgi:hypothetical protein
MDPPVLAALITASLSLVVAVGKIVVDWRDKNLERSVAAREQLDRYRSPLLAAVDDLGRRINNIRNDGFLTYLHNEDRRDTALLSTLFRFAQYIGWLEIVYGYGGHLRFQSDEATKAVAKTLADFGWILAADEFDRIDEGDFQSSRLMLWREEQRAIGELMRHEGDEPRCIGFNTFAENYDCSFARWFSDFAAQLGAESVPTANRLAELHRVAVRLIKELDVDHVLVHVDGSGRITSPSWAQRSRLPAPTRHTDPRNLGPDYAAP